MGVDVYIGNSSAHALPPFLALYRQYPAARTQGGKMNVRQMQAMAET